MKKKKMRAKLDDPTWNYTPFCATDIKETFARLGWIGPEEQRKKDANKSRQRIRDKTKNKEKLKLGILVQ
jgi:hypothetical protein